MKENVVKFLLNVNLLFLYAHAFWKIFSSFLLNKYLIFQATYQVHFMLALFLNFLDNYHLIKPIILPLHKLEVLLLIKFILPMVILLQLFILNFLITLSFLIVLIILMIPFFFSLLPLPFLFKFFLILPFLFILLLILFFPIFLLLIYWIFIKIRLF